MKFKKNMLTAFFLMLTALMLLHSEESLYYALTGLNLWFLKMIPTLFPFMILSGIMVRMNLTERFAGLFDPVLGPVFKVSKNGVYCIIMGFLCGFPMGAKVITELYERDRLQKSEAEFLLAFCNNIGPIYFISFALPTIGITAGLPYCIFGMYGLPLLYGLVLRYTKYRKEEFRKKGAAGLPVTADTHSLLFYADDAIHAAASGITGLGGYMILFNLLNLVPHAIFQRMGVSKQVSSAILPVLNGVLEITGGIHRMGTHYPMTVLLLLPFGGLSCIAQTYSIIKNTELSLRNYCMHKVILMLLTGIYYVCLHVCGVFSFAFWSALFS